MAIALKEKQKKAKGLESIDDLKIWVTDQMYVLLCYLLINSYQTNVYHYYYRNMVPLMQKNIDLNNLESNVFSEELDWGKPLPDYVVDPESPIDLVLAADCVYFEPAFPLLEKTLLDLTHPSPEKKTPLVLMSYKKRRKADSKFFRHMRKSFDFEEVLLLLLFCFLRFSVTNFIFFFFFFFTLDQRLS